MNDKHGDKILFAYCDAKAIAKATDLPPSAILKNLAGVSIVPTLQCWRKGQVIDEYITGKVRQHTRSPPPPPPLWVSAILRRKGVIFATH